MTAVISVIAPYKRIKSTITGNSRKKYLGLLSVILMLAMLLLSGSCRRSPLSAQLTEINAISETDPNRAFDSLRAINPDTLSERDRNYYDFLTVKCQRKQYQPAESDSLILKVLDYTARHKQDGYYPEALYTAGLVYTDLGDQPTALDYYQRANDALTDTTGNLLLKEKILSQTGRLFTNLKAYDEAEPYIWESLEIARKQRDTLSLVYEYHLLSGNYRTAHQYKVADSLLKEALRIGVYLPEEVRAITYMKIGEIKKLTGDMDSARYYVRQSIDPIVFHAKNIALAHAAQIYQQAGMTDSAYIFATRLIHSPLTDNKVCGYQILLSSPYRSLVPADSITSYYDTYTKLLDEYYNDNNNRMVQVQQASYNYQIQQKRREEADSKSRNRAIIIVILIVLLILAINIILMIRIRHRHKLKELQNALNDIKHLKTKLGGETPDAEHRMISDSSANVQETMVDEEEMIEEPTYPDFKENYTAENLRMQLQHHLMEIYNTNQNPKVDPRLLESPIYKKICATLKSGNPIPVNSPDWKRLSVAIAKVSPEFFSHLKLLYGGTIKERDYRIAMLIKCGFRTKEISILVSVTMGAINYYRRRLVSNFTNKEMGYDVMEAIIRQL